MVAHRSRPTQLHAGAVGLHEGVGLLVTTQDQPVRWLTTRQCADILHVTPGRIRHFVLDGRLPAYKGMNGRDLLISSEALANLVRHRRPSVQPT